MLERLLITTLLVWSFFICAVSGVSYGSLADEKPVIVSTKPANGSTGVNRIVQEIEIQFSKEMATGRSVSADFFWPLSKSTPARWSADHKTLFISRNNGNTLLPAGKVIHLTFNPPGHPLNFRDTFGNALGTYTLSFTTGQ